ncbi:MAG: right-handed parallel beta-helix repeat-containing protein, partial [archaeon]|nr:right-handed parallel beta-helix repeat-containing protein [archaeon]
MKLFDKRNIVLIMSIFLLLLMVSSVSAADVSDDAVVGNDAAIDTITSTDTDSGSIDDVISAEVSDNPKEDPSDSDESLSGDIVADASSNNDNSNENPVDDSSQDVLKASSDDEIISIDIPEIQYSIHVSPSGSDITGNGTEANPYATLSEALRHLTYSSTSTYEIVLHGGTYTGTSAQADIRRPTTPQQTNFKYLLIRAADGENVVMDGGNRRKLWSVYSENVVIQGITFVNASGSGAALEIQRSHVAVDNCTFIHCGGDNAIGGAVHIQRSSGQQQNVTDFNFTNCNFEQCYARVGGCMRTESTSSGVNLIGCNFTNNTATKHGAVTCLYGGDVLIENCMVVNNTASSAAGIQMHTADSVIKNTTFIGNKATGTGIGDDYGNGYGGAIGLVYSSDLGATIDGCTFINNSATQDGGAINIEGDGANAVITNCNFTNNIAPKGGAIIISGNDSVIENCTFFNNTANTTDGGAIYIDGRDTTINNVTLANNTAVGNGAGVLVNGTNTHITDSTVENNTAGGSGAGLYVDGRNTVIDGCDISNNNATVNGGGAYLKGSDATISNSNFTANNAIPNEDNIDEGLGGSVYVAGNNGHITDCDFTNNTARNGSAIYVNPVNPDNENFIDNCNFVDNQAWTYWMPIIYNTTHIESNITGGNNILNAIYNNGPNTSIFINGTNPVLGWENYNGTNVYQDDREAYQNVSVVVYDTYGNVVYNQSAITGLGGNVTFKLGTNTSDWFFVVMTHHEDTYYKYIVNATGIDIKPNITISSVIMYEGNETPQPVFVVIADGSANAIMLAGNITVYVKYNGDTLIANGTAKQGYFMFKEEEVFKTMPVGEYELTAVFNYIDKEWDESRQTYIDVPKQVSGTGELIILPYNWTLTKEIAAVNGQPYVEGMEIHVNDNITFNITVTNNVDADITSVKITDLDTVNLTYVSYEGSGWQKVDGANVWTLDNLPANGNSSLMVTFNILNYGNSINVANASIFSDKYNKSANATFKVTHVELGIVKTADPTEVYVGQNVTFTIVVTNNGDGIAHNVVITDKLNTTVFDYLDSDNNGQWDGSVVTW